MSLKEADLRYWKHAKVENVLSDNAGNCPISYYIEFPLSHTDRVKGFCNGMRKQLSFCKQWKIKIRKPTRIALLTLQRMHICVVSRDTVSDLVFFFQTMIVHFHSDDTEGLRMERNVLFCSEPKVYIRCILLLLEISCTYWCHSLKISGIPHMRLHIQQL